MRSVKTSVAGTGASPSTIWKRPPSIGLITSHRGDPPPPSSVPKTMCLPRRITERMRRAGSSLAKCSTGYRSMWAFLGLTVAAVISLFSSRGATLIRTASSSGNSGMPPRYGFAVWEPALFTHSSGRRHREVDQVGVDDQFGARALVVRHVPVAFARQEHGSGQHVVDRLRPGEGRGRVARAADQKDRWCANRGDRADRALRFDRPVRADEVGVLEGRAEQGRGAGELRAERVICGDIR